MSFQMVVFLITGVIMILAIVFCVCWNKYGPTLFPFRGVYYKVSPKLVNQIFDQSRPGAKEGVRLAGRILADESFCLVALVPVYYKRIDVYIIVTSHRLLLASKETRAAPEILQSLQYQEFGGLDLNKSASKTVLTLHFDSGKELCLPIASRRFANRLTEEIRPLIPVR